MATMLKSNDTAIAVMQQMLQERCIAEPSFAIKMANPSKSMEGSSKLSMLPNPKERSMRG